MNFQVNPKYPFQGNSLVDIKEKTRMKMMQKEAEEYEKQFMGLYLLLKRKTNVSEIQKFAVGFEMLIFVFNENPLFRCDC